MSSNRWGWSGVPDAADTTGEGENSSGIPGEALAGDDSRDGSQTAAKDDPKVFHTACNGKSTYIHASTIHVYIDHPYKDTNGNTSWE